MLNTGDDRNWVCTFAPLVDNHIKLWSVVMHKELSNPFWHWIHRNQKPLSFGPSLKTWWGIFECAGSHPLQQWFPWSKCPALHLCEFPTAVEVSPLDLCVASQLQHLSSEILKDCNQVHSSCCSHPSISCCTWLWQSVDTPHRKLQQVEQL